MRQFRELLPLGGGVVAPPFTLDSSRKTGASLRVTQVRRLSPDLERCHSQAGKGPGVPVSSFSRMLRPPRHFRWAWPAGLSRPAAHYRSRAHAVFGDYVPPRGSSPPGSHDHTAFGSQFGSGSCCRDS